MRPILVPTSGTLTTLHSFCSQSGCADGQYPTRPLIQATNGNLYGTELELELGQKLREERRFGSAEELRAQIGRDVAAVRAAE